MFIPLPFIQDWSGKTGTGWSTGVDRVQDWNGDWSGLGYSTGMGWGTGLEWAGVQDWNGLGVQTGLEWAGVQ